MVFTVAKNSVKRRRSYGMTPFPRKNKQNKKCLISQKITLSCTPFIRRKNRSSSECACFLIIREQDVIAKEATSDPDASVQLLEDSVLAL